MESHLKFSRWNIAFEIPGKIPKHPVICMVPRGVLCEITLILDLKKTNHATMISVKFSTQE